MDKAVVLMNLGSPDDTSVASVRRYLKEFLMDERVIDIPEFRRSLLVKGIIAPFRAPKSAEAYQSVWMKEGSPLIVLTEQLKAALEKEIPYPVYIAMRYGSFPPQEAFDAIAKNHPEMKEVLVIPLYPHYTMSSFETAALYAKEKYEAGNYAFNLSVIKPFFNNELYIKALAESIKPYILQADFDLLLFSYHGIPERHVQKEFPEIWDNCTHGIDCQINSSKQPVCYKHQCFETSKKVAKYLNLPDEKYKTTFQSRLGRAEWLKPYTAMQLELLPQGGVKKLLVACPAFVSDCLETLEEIGMQGKESFLHSGGTSFENIPCMNTRPEWINALSNWIIKRNDIYAALWE